MKLVTSSTTSRLVELSSSHDASVSFCANAEEVAIVDYEQPAYDDWEDAQPHEMWAHARKHRPVIEYPGNDWNPTPSFMTTCFAEADAVLRDWRTFSASINAEAMGPYMGDLMLGLDGEEHRLYRNLVAAAFKKSSLERWRTELIEPLLNQLLDDIAPTGSADLVAELTAKYPVQVICRIVGVPAEDHQQFNEWAMAINYGPLNPEEGQLASQAMVEYLAPLIESRRSSPTGDLLSELVEAEIDGERLSESKLYGFLRLLLPAGAETTYRMMGNCLVALLSNPDLLQRVTDDHDLIPKLIEEALRWESSVNMVSRVTTTDTEIGGCPVPKGAAVTVLNGSAGRDAKRWDSPDRFDIDREPVAHLAFGTGSHQCLGMHLARLELEVGIAAVLDRLPNLAFDPTQPDQLISGYAFRGPNTLHVTFDPS
jgi:cytochrome P450